MKMAKATKSVKKAKPAARKPATRRRPPKKRTPKKSAARKPATGRRSRSNRTTVTAIAELLPSPVGDNAYVSRTLTILEQDQRRRARSRATRAKQLEQVVVDIKQELTSRITDVEQSAVQTLEGIADRVKSTKVVQQAGALPDQVSDQVTEAVDGVLDRVGLMRKTLHSAALASRPARRRRRAA